MGDPTSKRGVSFDQIDSYMFQLAGEMVSARLELQQIGQRNETSSTSRIEDELKNLRSHTMYEKGYKEEYKEGVLPPALTSNRIIGAANGELIGALHVVGRPEAVNTIMKIMGSVKDWSAAHQHELKLQRQSWQLAL